MNGAHYAIPPVSVCMSVLPLTCSCPLFNAWTAWRISKTLGTHVNHIESTCRAELSDGLPQGQC